MKYYCIVLISVLFGLYSCVSPQPQPQKKQPPVILVNDPKEVDDKISKIAQELLPALSSEEMLVISDDSLFSTPFLLDFYKSGGYAPVWFKHGKLNFRGDSLLNVLRNADADGLIPSDYHFYKIENLLKNKPTGAFEANKLFEAEILLTDAFFTYAVHINCGRLNTDSLVREWHPQYLDTSLVQLLSTAIRHNTIGRTLHALEPSNNQYQLLKQALHGFVAEFKDVSWDSLLLRDANDSSTFKSRLKERLIASHDLFLTDKDAAISDSLLLVRGIKNFQCKNNLNEDGKIGKLTLKALQRTKADYIIQLQLNMERWRWKNIPKGNRYAMVNIPKYELQLIDSDTLYLTSRIIVGSVKNKTPQLKSTITNFLIYPYWNVPYKIATKELLPILKLDTSYLRKKNFEVLNGFNQVVDPKYIVWKKYDEDFFPWRLRQKTGDENSLGILKFNFQNKYGVYLHDTDNRSLFNREMRALSHGCVRVEKFLPLASYLIREDSLKYPDSLLVQDLQKQEQKYIYMRKPLPIYINYLTAEVNNNGELFYFIDVYNFDTKMRNALYIKSGKQTATHSR